MTPPLIVRSEPHHRHRSFFGADATAWRDP